MKQSAKKINTLTPLEAAKELKSLYNHKGRAYALEILMELQDIDRNRHGSNDEWWNEMMHEAGKDISDLF